MKSSSSQPNAAEFPKTERNWRFHRVFQSNPQPGQQVLRAATLSEQSTVVNITIPSTSGNPAQPARATRRSVWLAAFDRAASVFAPFESVLHRFALETQAANEAADVEAALLAAASRVHPKGRFEFLGLRAVANDQAASNQETQTHADSRTQSASNPTESPNHRDFPLCTGNAFHGRLRLHASPDHSSAHFPTLIQRLTTLCTLSASALENLRHHTEWSRNHSDRINENDELPMISPFTFDPAGTAEAAVCSSLRDATFLSAIFPFALSQAQRYRESLSMLCVSVDRIGGIRQLLGHEVANRLIDRVGQIVAATIRSSDIVARLDDDRIVALLVRAPGYSSMHVAHTLCRSVAEVTNPIPELPSVTISIGVASFPNHALNCFALYDAADNALAQAQAKGYGTVAIAPKNQVSHPIPAPQAI